MTGLPGVSALVECGMADAASMRPGHAHHVTAVWTMNGDIPYYQPVYLSCSFSLQVPSASQTHSIHALVTAGHVVLYIPMGCAFDQTSECEERTCLPVLALNTMHTAAVNIHTPSLTRQAHAVATIRSGVYTHESDSACQFGLQVFV